VLATGCTNRGDDDGTPGPTITLVDSIVLAEPSGDPLGAYTGFFGITPSGAVVISDIATRKVLRFGPDGSFLGQLGREGEGPGELRLPGDIIALPHLDAIGVIDANRSQLLIFDDQTGAFVREAATPFQRAGSSVAQFGDTVVFAPLLSSDALVRWDSRNDTFSPLAPLELDVPGMQSIVLSMGMPGVARADSALVLWYPVMGLTTFSLDGSGARRITVPVRLRRGEGSERIPEQMELRRSDSDSSIFSTSLGAGRLSSGNVVLASLDARRTIENGQNVIESDIRVYLTVLDGGLQRACVDGLVPLVTDASSVMAMHEGDAHFLARTVSSAGAVRTVVYRYRIDASRCAWQELGPGQQ
jgi:hypothetical protein